MVDTQTGKVRRLPDLPTRPIDLEWRPGTDQLAMTGESSARSRLQTGSHTPITVYSVWTGELRTNRLRRSRRTHVVTGRLDMPTLRPFSGARTRSRGSGSSTPTAPTYGRSPPTTGWNRAISGYPVWSPRGDQIVYQRETRGLRQAPPATSAARSSSSPRPTMTPRTPSGPSAPSRPSQTSTSTESPGSTRAGGTRTASRGHRTGPSCCTPSTPRGSAASSRRPSSTARRALPARPRPGHQPVHRLHNQALDRAPAWQPFE